MNATDPLPRRRGQHEARNPRPRLEAAKRRLITFAALLTVALWLLLLLLGQYILTEIQRSRIANLTHSGSLYIEGFLTDDVRSLDAIGTIPAERRREMQADFAQVAAATHLDALVIWGTDGNMIFASVPDPAHDDLAGSSEFLAALAGHVSAEAVLTDTFEKHEIIPPPYVEVYAPIRDDASGAILAIGEVYISASDMLAQQQVLARKIWSAIWGTGLVLAGLICFASYRQYQLRWEMMKAQHLADHNRDLMRAAHGIRRMASRSNEQLLNIFGAEIHDGPIQTLALLMLSDGADTVDPRTGHSAKTLISEIMSDLRIISNGLILPDISDAPLRVALTRAVEQHKKLTGQSVDADFDGLPPDVDAGLKICLYRFVQEGLRNAHRHARGAPVKIRTSRTGQNLRVAIEDTGGAGASADTARPGGLGLEGLRARIAVFDGTVSLEDNADGGKALTLTVPFLPPA